MPNRSRVRLGLLGPVTKSTSDVGAPAMPAGGAGGTGTASGTAWLTFGDCGTAAPGTGGTGVTAAWSCAGRCGIALSSPEISGPSFGSGALSFVPRGLRPVGGATGPGEGIFGMPAGGGTFASGELHAAAVAGGASLIGMISPTTVAEATVTDTIRRIANVCHLSTGRHVH